MEEILQEYQKDIAELKDADGVFYYLTRIVEKVEEEIKDPERLRKYAEYLVIPFVEKKLPAIIAEELWNTILWYLDRVSFFHYPVYMRARNLIPGYVLVILGYNIVNCPEFAEEILGAHKWLINAIEVAHRIRVISPYLIRERLLPKDI